MEIILAFIGGISLFFLITIYTTFSWGFVSFKFYQWFILSTFTELPHFSITQFVGFLLFVSVFVRHQPTQLKDEYKDKSSEWGLLLVAPWISLLIGFIIHTMYF
jgi:hypothetical protein